MCLRSRWAYASTLAAIGLLLPLGLPRSSFSNISRKPWCFFALERLLSSVMSEVTRILSAIEGGDPHAAEELLPLVYGELRKLAAQRLAQETPGQTLQATALVHEAYLRLVNVEKAQSWDSLGHFFAAAAEAMRRILIDNARGKQRRKRGGDRKRLNLESVDLACTAAPDELLVLDELIVKLGSEDADAAQIVKLRYFAGLSIAEAARLMGISRSSAYEHWAYARAWLRCALLGKDDRDQS
jgi:RNA polymerase sigma factor (TIGR02999 family)